MTIELSWVLTALLNLNLKEQPVLTYKLILVSFFFFVFVTQ